MLSARRIGHFKRKLKENGITPAGGREGQRGDN